MSTSTPEDGPDGGDEFTDTVIDLLGAVTREQVPAIEYVLVDALATWVFSDDNPGSGYGPEHAGTLIAIFFGAFRHAVGVDLPTAPDDEGPVGLARDRIVAGAHELAAVGRHGFGRLLARAVPSALAELEKHPDNPTAQLYSAYYYLLLGVATGTQEKASEEVAAGVLVSFQAWDGLFASGAVERLSAGG